MMVITLCSCSTIEKTEKDLIDVRCEFKDINAVIPTPTPNPQKSNNSDNNLLESLLILHLLLK